MEEKNKTEARRRGGEGEERETFSLTSTQKKTIKRPLEEKGYGSVTQTLTDRHTDPRR